MSLVSEAAARLRDCRDLAQRERLRNELAVAVAAVVAREVKRATRTRGLTIAEGDEANQELTAKLVAKLEAGGPSPRHGEEDAYVCRAARHGVLDQLAGKGKYKYRTYERPPVGDASFGSYRSADNPFDALAAADQVALVRECLADLNETRRDVVYATAFEGIPSVELAQRWFEEGRADSLKKAKQNVDAIRSRGLRELRAAIMRRLEEEGQ